MTANLTQEEFDTLCSATSGDEWNALCRKIKDARNGEFPDDWFTRMIASGVMRAVTSKFTKAHPHVPKEDKRG